LIPVLLAEAVVEVEEAAAVHNYIKCGESPRIFLFVSPLLYNPPKCGLEDNRGEEEKF
jgi:hypothetical protein